MVKIAIGLILIFSGLALGTMIVGGLFKSSRERMETVFEIVFSMVADDLPGWFLWIFFPLLLIVGGAILLVSALPLLS